MRSHSILDRLAVKLRSLSYQSMAVMALVFVSTLAACVAGPSSAGSATSAEPPADTASAGAVTTPTPVAPVPTFPVSLTDIPAGTVLMTTRTLGDPHITISPPGSATPAITSKAAFELCIKGVAGCLPEPPTEILLALLTDTAYGTTSSAGADAFPLKNTLVWAISWIGSSQCAFSGGGPAGPPGSLPTPAAPPTSPALCDSITFVNATTGAFIYNVAYAHQ
jgi:hypothetical protein